MVAPTDDAIATRRGVGPSGTSVGAEGAPLLWTVVMECLFPDLATN